MRCGEIQKMNDELFEFRKFYPISINDLNLRAYIDHHLSHLQKCYENSLYSSSYPHLHILYMAFVYFQLFRIAKDKKIFFKHSLIGFLDVEKKILDKEFSSPLSFCHVNEKPVFRFFRLVDFDDSTIDNLASPIKVRNDNLHASGKIICQTEDEFEKQFALYKSKMTLIIKKQNSFLTKTYKEIIKTLGEDYTLTNDDVELYFGSFSSLELEILSKSKNDFASRYIYQEFLGLADG